MPLRGARRLRVSAVLLPAVWLLAALPAIAGVAGTVHDFSLATGANTPYRDTTGWATMCNTCHIAHSSGALRPLWNHTVSTVTYSWSEVTTLAGTTLPANVGSSSSKACLSCHDGSVAIGSVIQGTSWGTRVVPSYYKVTKSGNSDMTGNHPVAIPFPDQAGAQYNGITTAVTQVNRYKLPTVAKVYGNTAGQKGVECGSCHDPHDTMTFGSFLRTDLNTLCVDCHNL